MEMSKTSISRRDLLTGIALSAAGLVLVGCGDDNDGTDGPTTDAKSLATIPSSTVIPIDIASASNLEVVRKTLRLQYSAASAYGQLKDTKILPNGSVTIGGSPSTPAAASSPSSSSTTIPAGSVSLFNDTLRKPAVERASAIHTSHISYLIGFAGRYGAPTTETTNSALLDPINSLITNMKRTSYGSEAQRNTIAGTALNALATLEQQMAATILNLSKLVRVDEQSDLALSASRSLRTALVSTATASTRISTYFSMLQGSNGYPPAFADLGRSLSTS